MIDYHLHLWPHSESSVWFRLDQIAAYCDEAARHGVNELALTEHSHRFVDVASVVGPFWERFGHEPTSKTMAAYWDFHARNSLEEYVTLAQRAKDEGLPVKIGLEVDYYKDQMGAVSELLAQYPFDVLIGSVHWLGTWHLDDYESEVDLHEWRVRDVDQCWRDYAVAIDELCATNAVDVLAHPDLIKVAGFIASSPGDTWDAMAESAAKADVSMECSSASGPRTRRATGSSRRVSRSRPPPTRIKTSELASARAISRRCSRRAGCTKWRRTRVASVG